MWVRHLELVDFRSYERAEIELGPGLTAVVGANGQGKSNLMEAVGYLATLESFRGVPGAALVREGSAQAVVRAEVVQPDRRVVTIECELASTGRDRVLVNKQRLRRTSDLLGVVRVTVFSPDDLALVKEGPALRRRFLDQTAVNLQPRADADRRDLERILKHKSTLLKQVGGRLGEDAAFTLDVWNVKLAEVGERIGRARDELVAALGPQVGRAYTDLAGGGSAAEVEVRYEPAWRATGLAEALAAAKVDEVRRQVCLVGPHRDDLELRRERATGPHPRVAGRAADPGARAAPGRAPVGGRTRRRSSGARPRRRVLRARPGSERGPPPPPPPGPGAADDGRSAPGRRGRRAHDPRGAGQADGMSASRAPRAMRARSAGRGAG